jgi:excisionase family DNA binding protein
MDTQSECLTMSVPAAGKLLGIGKSLAYEAAARGDIPTIRIGRLLRVPIRAVEQMLDAAGRKSAAA